MYVLGGTQSPQVEDGAQVDVEPFAPLPRERLHTIPEILHRGTRQGCVVRRGPRSNPNRGVGRSDPKTLRSPSSRSPWIRLTVYDWRTFQFGSVREEIGPVLYRKVPGFCTTVLKRNWYTTSSSPSPSLSIRIS